MLKIFVAVFLSLFFTLPTNATQSASETTLAAVRRSDAADRDAQGNLRKLMPAEHMRRAAIYLSVRAFAEARAHWQAFIDNYPQDPRVPEALLGIGRSYFLGKIYQDGYVVFNQLAQQYNGTKEGREALNFSAASLLRMGKFSEAAARYAEYVDRFPSGERIDTAHLNVIDTLREANKPAEALQWVTRTRQRFAGTAVETNAMFAALRLYVAENQWTDAVNMADQLLKRSFPKAVQTSPSEVAYLKAYSLEHAGRKNEAFTAYLSVPDSIESYYGWLATQRLEALAGPSRADIVAKREERVNSAIDSVSDTYPAPYRQAILSAAKSRKLDPRFILALIRQESVFKPLAKSPAGARGLLQLTMDAAQKYGPGAGLNSLRENQLYQPETSITVGAEYIEYLTGLFPKMLEPIAASYNGGEDNVARWLERSKRTDPGVFTAEVGFDETKDYVQKVMSNYRVYRQLYTADLMRK
ncbi:MAG TPA: transglycosylase SLT domain-containing protein [Pyrinomonadaceae bacterium]|nr:transglycosylase SLT domain-containing protein [Pyrinomonadaceae bacterium]